MNIVNNGSLQRMLKTLFMVQLTGLCCLLGSAYSSASDRVVLYSEYRQANPNWAAGSHEYDPSPFVSNATLKSESCINKEFLKERQHRKLEKALLGEVRCSAVGRWVYRKTFLGGLSSHIQTFEKLTHLNVSFRAKLCNMEAIAQGKGCGFHD